jgi:DnaJ-like protein/uncharacterized protein DUF4388
MQLQGRLRSTTLGDLLGVLHRGAATGSLELVEDRGRVHRVHLSAGLVSAVEIDGASPSLAEFLRVEKALDEDVLRRSLLRALVSKRLHGQVLVDEFNLAPSVVGRALRRQLCARLVALEQVKDARVAFRVTVRPPRSALLGTLHDRGGPHTWDVPLGASEFLHGRRRARERTAADAAPVESSAWDVLGLAPGAAVTDVKRAYRRLARAVHPDLHPGVSDVERCSLQVRFAKLTDAYRSLVA